MLIILFLCPCVYLCACLKDNITSLFVFSAVGKMAPGSRDVDADLTPPLELCIRTRYESSAISKTRTNKVLEVKGLCWVF